MNISKEKTDDCQLKLTVEVDGERVEKHLKGAARRLADKVRIPGFRKGKAPYSILVQTLGMEALYEEALEELGQEVYTEALEKEEIEPYAQAQLEGVSFDPMVLTFVVPLLPEINLNDYRDIRIESEEVVIEQESVDEALERLQEERAEWQTVDRPLAEGDMAVTHVRITQGDETLDDSDRTFVVNTESIYPAPGFQANLVDMGAGETKDFELTYPDDWRDEKLAGRAVQFSVEVREVQEKVLPELNDEFALLVGDYESLDDLRAQVNENLTVQAEHAAQHKMEDAAIDDLLERADIVFPAVMLEDQLDEMLKEQDMFIRQQQGVSLEDFVKMTGQNMDDLRSSLTEHAEKRLKRSLAMGRLAELENLKPTGEEMRAQAELLMGAFEDDPATMQEFLSTPQGLTLIRREILNRKSTERLLAIARGEEPEIEADAPVEPGAGDSADQSPVEDKQEDSEAREDASE